MVAIKADLESDLIHLARLALAGRTQDIQMLLQRIARKNRGGKPELSDSLTALLREAPTRETPLRRQAEIPMPVDADSRFHLLRIEENAYLDHEPIHSSEVAGTLKQLVDERRQMEALHAAGLDPTRTALFVGPPGVGKTMGARWLARELGKPLIILDLAAVMSSYLGRTGANLRHVLDYAKSADCVLLLDELDAIAKRRDDRGEIGELKRLVTVLLQQIDDWPPTGLLVAATNHPDLLDPAIWRRFEVKVDFPMPDRAAVAAFTEGLLRPYISEPAHWGRILSVSLEGQSFSDIQQSIERVRRAVAVSGDSLDERLHALINIEGQSKSDRIVVATMLVEAGLSQRNVQKITGIARDTVRSRTQKSDGVEKKRSA